MLVKEMIRRDLAELKNRGDSLENVRVQLDKL